MRHGLQLCVACLVAVCVILPATARAEDARELKTFASAQDSSRAASIGPVQLDEPGSVVIRSAEELVASSSRAKSAKDPAVQKEIEAELARLLQLDAINWSTQMVLAVRGEPGTKADRVRFDSLKVEDKVLTVAWKVNARPPHAGPGTPIALILVERFDGEVKFVPSGQMMPTTLRADEPMELKIIASASDPDPVLVRLKQENSGVVLRSAQELVAHSSKADSAKDAAIQKAMESELAKRLKLENIDWSKQMVLAVQGHATKGEYGTIRFGPPKIDGKVLTVSWKQEHRVTRLATVGPPTGFALVERSEGDVKFIAPAKK